jgi:DNA-binding SARP family transcriptional activator/tetratricopeptide (TPR) repeat protein
VTARVRHVVPPPRATWRLELLGGATLIGVNGERAHLERKTAGVLALLALEGEVARSRVAGLLWADTDEERARANLRQCLHRLKKLSAADLVQSGERLAVTAALEVDTVTLESRAFLGDDAGLIAVRGEILEGLDFEDCPEFTDWLLVQRERWRGARGGAYRRALQDPSNPQALVWAREWVNLEPISEEAHRALARALDAQHNRAQALQILRDFETLLRRELNVAPSNETRALRESLERDEPTAHPQPTTLPRDVLSPPRLVGRAREWTQLERAWAAGVNIVVRGAPGVGKSRLVLDFVATRTRFDVIEARPGDANVPMAAFARTLRQLLPDPSTFDLPTWVETELSRLLPELNHAVPPPMTTEADKLRFFEALFVVTERRFLQGVEAIVIDDLQFMDAASFEALRFNAERERRLGVRTVTVYRSGELNSELEALIAADAASGAVQIIDLNPLEADALSDLVGSLKLETPAAFTAQLQQRTGGNPLYALETIRALLEQNALRGNLETLPVPALVRQITAQRLERRSLSAQRVAQVAAVAGTDFTLELAAFALDAHPLDLQDALSELEDAQIMRGERFQHDLLLEGVLSAIGSSVRRFLHRRCAEFLESTGDPARVATHWLEGGVMERAVPLFLRAANRARDALRHAEAADLLERAAVGLETLGRAAEAFDHRLEIHSLYTHFENGARHDALVERLLSTANTPQQHLKAWIIRTTLHLVRGQVDAAATAADCARAHAVSSGDERLEIEPLNLLGIILRRQGQVNEALHALERSRALCERFDETEPLAAVLSNLGLVLQQLQRRDEAARSFRAAADHQRDPTTRTRVLNNLAMLLLSQGRMREALRTLEESRDLLETTSSASNAQLVVYTSLGNALRTVGNYVASLEYLRRAERVAGRETHWKLEDLHRNFARLYIVLGRLDLAQTHLDRAFEACTENPRETGLIWFQQARIHRLERRDATDAFARAEALLSDAMHDIALHGLRLERAQGLPAIEARPLLHHALKFATDHQLYGLEIAARTRLANVALASNDPTEALIHTRHAWQLTTEYESDLYHHELRLEHFRALEANRDPETKRFLEDTVTNLLETATQRVPREFKDSFLNVNPVNRVILETARASGLNLNP